MFQMTVHNNQGRDGRTEGRKERKKAREATMASGERAKERRRETRTSTTCAHREMTPGHPEACGLSRCLAKPHTPNDSVCVPQVFIIIPDYGWGMTMGW